MFSSRCSTIIAPATVVGESGIAILRISGSLSLSFLKQYFNPRNNTQSFASHRLYLGYLVDRDHKIIDEIMAVYMEPGRSYTYEPVVELHCHGSPQVVKEIITLAQHYGIDLAQPGEFTYRAFINGRLDLTQAEAVCRLIHSKSDFSRRAAINQMDGFLSRQISQIVMRIRQHIAYLEAWIDFPEEDIPEQNFAELVNDIKCINDEVGRLTESYHVGQIVADGASVVLAGLPNSGKSSLLNALLKRDRAIVSDIPGTTRDTIEEALIVNGLKISLADTAGLRHTTDPVEQLGVMKSYRKLEAADLILFLHDAAQPFSSALTDLMNRRPQTPLILVLTKTDLVQTVPSTTSFFDGSVCTVSSVTGDGLQELMTLMSDTLFADFAGHSEAPLVTERRHYDTLIKSKTALDRFVENSDNMTLDLLVSDLRQALISFEYVTGSVTTDDILDDIFSNFCIGK